MVEKTFHQKHRTPHRVMMLATPRMSVATSAGPSSARVSGSNRLVRAVTTRRAAVVRRVAADRENGSSDAVTSGDRVDLSCGAPPCDDAVHEVPADTSTPMEAEKSGDCPYTAAKDAVSSMLSPAMRNKMPEGGPVMLPSNAFFKSLLKAGSSPVGMPEAMLEWVNMTGHETVGIKNAVGPMCVSTVDPDIVEYVCHTNAKNYRLRMLPDAFRYVIKNKGITGSDGSYNREHRLMCQKPFMNSFSLEQFSHRVEERVGLLCDAWARAASNTDEGNLAIDIDDHSQRLTLDIVTSLAFNMDFKQVEGIDAQLNGGEGEARSRGGGGDLDYDIIDKVLHAYNNTSEIMGELFITPVPILKLQNLLGIGRVRELREGYAVLEDVGINHIIGRRRKELEENKQRGDNEDYCLLDVLLKATDADGNPLPKEDVWGDVNDIMAAGHRTTASNLTVNLHHLARLPEVQRKVEEEVAALGGRAPTFADVQEGRLQYTQRVVKESLRKYAPINLFPRVVEGDDTLPTGHEVKAGDFILLSSWAMGRNPRVWDEPDAFEPDRFTEESLRANSERLAKESCGPDATEEELRLQMERMSRRILAGRDFTYTPFGSGPRSCIGGTFALLATTVALATTVQRFKWSTVATKDPGFEIPFLYDTTITFPQGVHVTATPREVPLGATRGSESQAGVGEQSMAPAR